MKAYICEVDVYFHPFREVPVAKVVFATLNGLRQLIREYTPGLAKAIAARKAAGARIRVTGRTQPMPGPWTGYGYMAADERIAIRDLI